MVLAYLLDTQLFAQQPVWGPSDMGTDGEFFKNWLFFFFEALVVITVGEKQASMLDL